MPVTGQPLSFRVDNELFHAVDVPTAAAPPPGGGPRPRFTRSSLMRLGVARVRQSHRRAEEIAEAEAQARAILQPTSRSVSRRSASEDPPLRGRSRDESPQRRASPPKSRPPRPSATPGVAPISAQTPPRAPPRETPRTQRIVGTPSAPASVERAASPSASPARDASASTALPDIAREPAPQPGETARSANGTSVTGWSTATPPRAVAFGHAVVPTSLPFHAPQPPGPTGVSLQATADVPQNTTPAGRRPASSSFGHAPSPGGCSVALAASNFYDDDVAHSIQRHARPAATAESSVVESVPAEVPDVCEGHPQLEAIFSAPFIAGLMVGVIATLHVVGRNISLQHSIASQH